MKTLSDRYQPSLLALVLLGVLAFLLGAAPRSADAAVRIRVHVGPRPVHVVHRPVPHPVVVRPVVVTPCAAPVVRVDHVSALNPRDSAIARRVARHAGVRLSLVVDLRARGWSWARIGRRCGLDQPTMRILIG